jgi:lysophospholipase L1-like esterase
VADTFDAIPCQPTFFQADGVHLNSLGHMVLSLFLSELPCVMELRQESTVA